MDEYILSNLSQIVKCLWQLNLSRQRSIIIFSQTKLCDKKVNRAQFDWLACAGATYIFCAAVTKIAIFVMIANSLCAVPAH